MRESQIVKEIKDWIKGQGGKAVKIHGGPFSEAGVSDLLCVLKGYFIAIEVKVPGKLPTAIQINFLKEIAQAGGLSIVATSVSDVKKTMADAGLVIPT